MTHYVFADKKKQDVSTDPERWETLAAFMTFLALVVLAGVTYGALTRDDIYSEMHEHEQLTRFAGMLEDTSVLHQELTDYTRYFTLIAPTNNAFKEKGITFIHDEDQAADKRLIRIGEQSFVIQVGAHVVRSHVTEEDVPFNEVLHLPTASGDIITLTREVKGEQELLIVNGIPVKEHIRADNGVIYVVDSLIHPLYSEVSPSMVLKK